MVPFHTLLLYFNFKIFNDAMQLTNSLKDLTLPVFACFLVMLMFVPFFLLFLFRSMSAVSLRRYCFIVSLLVRGGGGACVSSLGTVSRVSFVLCVWNIEYTFIKHTLFIAICRVQ